MDILIPLIMSVISLFIMMIPGVILKKCNLVTQSFGKGLSNLVLYIAQPMLILFAYLDYEGDANILWNILWVFLLSVVAHVIFSLVAVFLFRGAEDGRRRMLRFATVFSNAAFMGIPLISEIPALGPEATIYASIYNITFNLFLWSLGVYFCTARRDEDGDGTPDGEDKSAIVKKNPISPLKVIFHPVNIASFVGLLCLIFSVREHLSGLIDLNGELDRLIIGSLEKLKHLVGPLSMVVIGLRIPDISFRGAFRDKYLYLFLALRHLLLPGAVLLILWGLTALGAPISEMIALVVLILAATPAATSATMFAEKYDCDSVYTSRTVTISTLLSVATMPLLIFLYGVLV